VLSLGSALFKHTHTHTHAEMQATENEIRLHGNTLEYGSFVNE